MSPVGEFNPTFVVALSSKALIAGPSPKLPPVDDAVPPDVRSGRMIAADAADAEANPTTAAAAICSRMREMFILYVFL